MIRRLACLMAALILALPVPALAALRAPKTDWFVGADGFAHAHCQNARFDAGLDGFRLLDGTDGGYQPSGTVVLDELRYNGGFDQAIASWNAVCPPGTWITVELQVSADEGANWSAWYEMAQWGDAETLRWLPAAPHHLQDAFGRVETDTLSVKRTCDRVRYRVTLHSRRPEATPVLSALALSVANQAYRPVADDTPDPAWGQILKVAHRSQGAENGDLSWRLCGPTSAAMALDSCGVRVPTAQVAKVCWDARDQDYGNWAFLAAGMSALLRAHADEMPPRAGQKRVCRAYVSWPENWKPIEAEIRRGHPVLVPIAFGPGELPGSATKSSEGHIVLVCGFTRKGDVVCADPAWARKETVIYDRHALERARHGVPVIVLDAYDEAR